MSINHIIKLLFNENIWRKGNVMQASVDSHNTKIKSCRVSIVVEVFWSFEYHRQVEFSIRKPAVWLMYYCYPLDISYAWGRKQINEKQSRPSAVWDHVYPSFCKLLFWLMIILFSRSKPEAVEVTFAGKWHCSKYLWVKSGEGNEMQILAFYYG